MSAPTSTKYRFRPTLRNARYNTVVPIATTTLPPARTVINAR